MFYDPNKNILKVRFEPFKCDNDIRNLRFEFDERKILQLVMPPDFAAMAKSSNISYEYFFT